MQKEIINEVKTFINTTFNIKNAKEIMAIKPKNILILEKLANSAYSNNRFSSEEQKEVCLYSSLKRSRRYLLDQLNKIRLKSGLNLTETSFNNIGEILKNSLNEYKTLLAKRITNARPKAINISPIIISGLFIKSTKERHNKLPIFSNLLKSMYVVYQIILKISILIFCSISINIYLLF